MVTFSYIRHKIQKFKKVDILNKCYAYLLANSERVPVWDIFLLMKWTYLYGEEKYPPKEFTDNDFAKIVNSIAKLNDEHVTSFLKAGNINKGFQILYSQQFYLQKSVYKEVFATQLKLYTSLKHKYDLEKSFLDKTGLSIFEFIYLLQITWLFTNSNKLDKPSYFYNGTLPSEFWEASSQLTSNSIIEKFRQLLTLDPANPIEKIKTFKRGITKEEFQSLETTFFTMFPFQIHNGEIRVIHASVFKHTVNYFVYDYLKANDILFGAEFGKRFEKYIELGLQEVSLKYKTENDLKKMLPPNSNVVDFMLEDENIFIECKAIELQPYPSINPTDELIYNSLKDSIIKAYSKQLLPTAKLLKSNCENWGIILTYKQLFWSKFSEVWKVAKKELTEILDDTVLPPENVYIIDIYAWNEIIQIIKEKKATLTEILKKAKENNSKGETSKQLFEMHLDEYGIKRYDLTFLEKELDDLQIRKIGA